MLFEEFTQEEAIEMARAEGVKLGREEGEHIAQLKIAENMLAANLDIETIAKATGLTPEEVVNLTNK